MSSLARTFCGHLLPATLFPAAGASPTVAIARACVDRAKLRRLVPVPADAGK